MAKPNLRRVFWSALAALLLSQAAPHPGLVPEARAARSRTAAATTTSTGRTFDAARTVLDAQNALPVIRSHLSARRLDAASVLIDRTTAELTHARAQVKDRRMRDSIDDARKQVDRLADRVRNQRLEAQAALPSGTVLIGPPSAAAGVLAIEIAPAVELPLPREDDDPAYALAAVDDAAIPIESHPLVDKWLDYFTGRGRPTFERWLERSGRYMDAMKQILAREGVPTDLVHLVFVESGFNPQARSVAHAVGPWQFIRGTANLFGLKVNSWVDERKDPEASTVAAARYLKHLHGMFNSWPLALASYNAGEGAVGRAIKRQGTSDFWSLRLPDETRNYVPKFMAVLTISRDPARYGFAEVDIAEPLEYDEVTIPGPVDLFALAAACSTDAAGIRDLNPQFLRGAAPARGEEVTLRVPEGAGERLMARLADGTLELPRIATPADPLVLRHKVKRGESLKSLSLRYGVPASTIAHTNQLGKSSRLRVGRTLRIPQGTPRPRGETKVAQAPRGSAPAGAGAAVRTRTVRVKRGQTLSGIASTYGISVAELRRANGLGRRSGLQAGQELTIPRPS